MAGPSSDTPPFEKDKAAAEVKPVRPRGSGAATIQILCSGSGLGRDLLGWLDRQTRRVVDHLGVGGDCRIRLADDAEVEAAHLRHLGTPGTTDVITFDLTDPSDPGALVFLDTDLLVCVDEARRQSARRGTAIEQELLLYIVHGMLHCLGHDDHSEAGSLAMHRLEDEILEAVGVGAVFSRRERDAAAKGGAA